MKKLLILFLFVPLLASADFTVGWRATSTTQGSILPNKILNVEQAIGLLSTATSTATNGFNITGGCYAINGTCIGTGSITGSGTQGQLAFWTSSTALGSVATTTAECAGSVSCNQFVIIGGSPVTITGSGGTAGSSKWATTTNNAGLYPNGGTGMGVIIGGTATTSNTKLEVVGTTTASQFVGNGTATSTFTNGLNLSGGCFAISGTCVGGYSDAFEIATTSNIAVPQLAYFTRTGGRTTLGSVATTTVSCSGNTSCTGFVAIGSSPITISSTGGGTGLSTTSPISDSNVLVYSSAGAGSAYGVATGTVSSSGGITTTASRYVLNGALSIVCDVASSLIPGCLSAADWTTFNNKQNSLGSGTGGQILAWLSGTPTWTATTTFSGGLTYSNGNVTNTLTAGDGLTRTVDDIDCDTASGTTFGCLSSTDWSTFNNKQNTISVTWPITLSGATIGFNGLATTSPWTTSNLAYVVNGNTVSSVATTTVSCSGATSCTQFTAIGGSPITISSTAGASAYEIATTSDIAVPQVAYFTKTGGLTTLGSVATGTISSANSALTVTSNRYVLGGNAVFTIATTSNNMFTGTAGQVLAYLNGGWTGTATTTFSGGLTYANGNVTNTLTAGDGLTRTVDDIDCDTANGTTFGCLTSTDWSTFNGKLSSYDAWTHPSAGVSATTSSIILQAGTNTISFLNFSQASGTNATSTNLTVTGNTILSNITSALMLTGANGAVAEYTGTTCTNSFVRALSALGVATCETVDISADTNLTAGDGLTLTNDDIDCDTASASVFGCLSTTLFDVFNNKVSSTSLSGATVISYTPSTGVITTTGGTFGSGDYVFPSKLGIATSTPARELSVVGSIYASSTATTTFQGGGINLITSSGNRGCFAVDGVCMGVGGSGAGGYVAYWINDNTLSASSNFSFASADEGILTTGVIRANNRVAIATTTNAFALPIYGTIFASSTGAQATSTFQGQSIDLVTGSNGSVGCYAINGACIGASSITSVSNLDGSLTISPTTGAVVGSINVAHRNDWSVHQTFTSLFGINATITNATTTNLHITSLTSALLQADANGKVGEYAGSTCGANTFVQTLSALGVVTCDNVDLSTADVTGTLPRANGGTGSTSYTTGSVIFANATKLIEDATNFFWDDTNNFLGLGTAVPTARLDLQGSVPQLVIGQTATQGSATTTNSFWNDSSTNLWSSYTGDLKLDYNGTMFRNATITSFRNSNTATSIIPPATSMVDGTTTIPANFLTPGMHVNVETNQLFNNATTPVTVTQGIYMNSTLICSTSHAHTGAGGGKNMITKATLAFMQDGANTKVWCSGSIHGVTLTGTTIATAFMTNTAPVTVDLTLRQNIDVKTTWSTANNRNQATTTKAIIRIE